MLDITQAIEQRIRNDEAHAKVIKKRKQLIRELAKKIPEIPQPKSIDIGYLYWPIYLTYPIDPELEKQVVELLEQAGFEVLERSEPSSTGFDRMAWLPEIYKQDTTAILHIIFKDIDGSQCTVRKIGTKKIEVEEPVYEVVCREGALETW